MSPRSKTLRLGIYRYGFKRFASWVDRRRTDEDQGFFKVGPNALPNPHDKKSYFWIHAASAGELESLEPVALALASRGISIFLTVFSPSAKGGFLRLRDQLRQFEGVWLGGGLSPFEGAWGELLTQMPPPRYFITAKYEAWPELWASALEYQFPILIVGAQARSSLRWANWILRFVLGVARPKLLLAAFNHSHRKALQALQWKGVRVVQVRDPRWDGVIKPSRRSQRAEELLDWASRSSLPRPWGMIGNSWMSDFNQIPSLLKNEGFAKTLWVIPHEVRGADFEAQELLLKQLGVQLVKTSQLDLQRPRTSPGERRIIIWVDEMGVLKSLYRGADTVFVGGGFGRGLHNVMEPSSGGALVIAGPKGADRFAEVNELEQMGQLSIVSDESGFSRVISSFPPNQASEELRQRRKEALTQMCGGTSDVLSALFGA